jgi:hypothetical protein
MKLLSWIPALTLLVGLPCAASAQGTSVALIVDPKFKANLEQEIARLAADIERDLSTQVIIHTVDLNTVTPESIRICIKELYRTHGLRGTILIGDIPAARCGDINSSAPFLNGMFYEDLDDECWADPDGNGIYNLAVDENGDGINELHLLDWIGEHNREVWSGRLLPPQTIPLADRVELLRKYLDRDHLYRTGVISYKRGLIYSENISSDDSATIVDRAVQVFDGSWLFHREQGDTLIQCQAADPVSRMSRWMAALRDSVEYAYINVHGTQTSQWFGESSWLYSSDYRDTPVNACVVDLASCSNGDFSDPDYLAGWVLFSGAALVVKANTTLVLNVGSPKPNPDHRLLSLGQSFGNVRLANVSSNVGVLFGDPTLRLRNREPSGSVLDHDTSITVLPAETVQSDPRGYGGGVVRLKNQGDQPLQTYLRIVSLASINGKRPDVQCYFSVPEFKESYVFDKPLVLQPGQSILTPVTFYYEAATPDDTSGASAYLGTFRARACIYTDSPASPFIWLLFEKTLTPFAPEIPHLCAPADGAVSQPLSLTLMWNQSARASAYHVQLSTDTQFGSCIVNDSSIVDTVRPVAGMASSTTYYWKVRAKNVSGYGPWGSTWHFSTIILPPSAVQLSSPADGAVVNTDTVRFVWRRAHGSGTTYAFELATDSLFKFKVADSSIVDTARLEKGLFKGKQYWWRVKARNAAGWGPYSSTNRFEIPLTSVESQSEIPKVFCLAQNYPNPFNPTTVVSYQLPVASTVRLVVIDLLGREVVTLVDEKKPAGVHKVQFDGKGLASGVYLYRMQAGSYVETKKLILVR